MCVCVCVCVCAIVKSISQKRQVELKETEYLSQAKKLELHKLGFQL